MALPPIPRTKRDRDYKGPGAPSALITCVGGPAFCSEIVSAPLRKIP
jgi:hypothetical protein